MANLRRVGHGLGRQFEGEAVLRLPAARAGLKGQQVPDCTKKAGTSHLWGLDLAPEGDQTSYHQRAA